METFLVYEKEPSTGYEYWRERKTGRVLRFKCGSYNKLYDSRGNVITIDDGIRSVTFKYNDSNKLISESYSFSKSNATCRGAYRKWYSYDENGKIMSIVDSEGNEELYDEDGIPFYSVNKNSAVHALFTRRHI